MPSYLVETFLPDRGTRKRSADERRLRSAADALSRDGQVVRFDHSIYIPSDETCFFVFEAPSASNVALAAAQAGLEAVRIVEAATSRKETQ
jgi:hypothetical protein